MDRIPLCTSSREFESASYHETAEDGLTEVTVFRMLPLLRGHVSREHVRLVWEDGRRARHQHAVAASPSLASRHSPRMAACIGMRWSLVTRRLAFLVCSSIRRFVQCNFGSSVTLISVSPITFCCLADHSSAQQLVGVGALESGQACREI